MQRAINWSKTDMRALYALLAGFAVLAPLITRSGSTVVQIYGFLAATALLGLVVQYVLNRPARSSEQLQDAIILVGIVATTGFVYLARPFVANSYLAYLAATLVFGSVYGRQVSIVVGGAGVAAHLSMAALTDGLAGVINGDNLLGAAAILGVAFVYGRVVDLERYHKKRAEARTAASLDLYDQLEARTEQLAALHEMDLAIASESDLPRLLETVRRCAQSLLRAKTCQIALLNPDRGTLSFTRPYGIEPVTEPEIRLGEGIIGQVASEGRPIVVSDDCNLSVLSRSRNTTTVATVPMKWQDKVLGVIQVADDTPRRVFSDGDLDLLCRLGTQAAVAIQNIGLMQEKVRLLEEKADIEAEKEADRLRSEFVSTISHELRTPLSSIKGYATTLLRKDVVWDEESRKEFLQIIDEESDRLRELIDDVLDVSKIGAGVLKIEKRPINLEEMVTRAAEQVASKTTLHKFEVSFVEDFPSVQADARRIWQVVHNLIENAVKYSPNGGRIRVQGVVEPTEVKLAVSDEGIGISSWNLSKVFERFYRVDNSITRETRGSGLGLSICRGIVEAHGGRIWAESSVGKGSTFWVTLPNK